MAGYLGNIPTAIPLSSADLADGIITSAKIADGTIVNADINASAAIVSTKLSGVASGLTAADQWRLSANFTIAQNGGAVDLTTNWEQNDSTGFTVLGSSMTQSSGIFTFPSTGYWFIQFITNVLGDGSNRYIGNKISVTIDNSTYTAVADIFASTHTANADATIVNTYIFDVTSTANCKVKFSGRSDDTQAVYQSSTTQNKTCVTFLKLGDT